MQLVDIQHVSRAYGPIQALCDVSLTLEPGTIGLVGNNGAGKSTLLKILLGLLEPDQGQGTILGCNIRTASRALRGRVGYMPEAAATVPVLRGVEFVTLSGDLYGMPHRDARRRAHEVLSYLGLGELRYRRLEEYSAGNLQRLKLAAALVHDPDLLLLDEPTNGLDPTGRGHMLRLIEDLIAETGKSVIICTHLLGDVERLCDQIVVLHQGTVIRAGSVAEIRHALAGRFELGWHGPSEAYLAALEAAGVEIVARHRDGALVQVPAAWRSRDFFELARGSGAILARLKPEEENLERMFFRVTEGAPAEPAADRQDVAHGH